MIYGYDEINLKKSVYFKKYLQYKKYGLYLESYIMYRKILNKYKSNVDFYYSILKYSVMNNFIGDSLKYRINILYRLKVYPYIICFDNKYLKYYYPDHYNNTVEKIIKKEKFKLDTNLIYSLIRAESLFQKSVNSPANAIGLFQVMPSTADYLKKKLKLKTNDSLHSVYLNTKLGLYYFNWLFNKYNKNKIFSLGAYNAGSGRIKKWKKKIIFNKDYPEVFIELIPFFETRTYIKKILTSYYFYSNVYSGE